MTLVRQSSAEARSTWSQAESASLARGMADLGLQPASIQLAKLRAYGELLLKWNRTYNLLGATSARALVDDHLLDSLAILPALTRWLPMATATEGPLLLDIGSGAGLPGIVLAVMLEHLPIALVEPNGKKAAFLRQAVAECSLPRAVVIEARVEDLDTHKDLPRYPAATLPGGAFQPHFICRAFTSLERFAGLCQPLLRPGSLLFAMKAARVGEELEQLSRSIEVLAVEPLCTLEKDVQRNLVVMRAKDPHGTSDPTGPGP